MVKHNKYLYFIVIPYGDVPILPIQTAAQLILEKKNPENELN